MPQAALKSRPEARDGELLAEAVRHRVAFVPGQPFFASGAGANTLRLSYVTSSEQQIRTGLTALAAVIAERLNAPAWLP